MQSLAKVSLLLGLCSIAFADVAPDPGYSNVSSDLRLHPVGDISAYRFFLESPNKIEEITLPPGEITTIGASGRAGVVKVATLVAVPISDMTISGDLSGTLLDHFIRENKFPNARRLLTHYFQTTIPTIERPVWTPPVHYIKVEYGEITAQKSIDGVGRSLLGRLLVFGGVAGVLIAVGIAIIGIWLFRSSRKEV
jgi:hypothetical protein